MAEPEAAKTDLPFVADYAKSGRAKCRSCKDVILYDQLRLGIMVQSPHFDGMQSNWYHFPCFWKLEENTVTSTSQIADFDFLRWNDQEWIREFVGAGGSTPWLLEHRDAIPQDYYLFYGEPRGSYSFKSKYSSSYKCSACDQRSRGNEVVVRHIKANSATKYATVYYYHPTCFVKPDWLANAEWKDTYSVEMVQGFRDLDRKDQNHLREVFPVPRWKQKAETSADEPDAKRAKIVEQYQEKLKAQIDSFWALRDKLQENTVKDSLEEILRANGQLVPFVESELLDRVAECLFFGPLAPCTECNNGQLVLSTGGYRCQGNVSSWTKCTVFTQDVRRKQLVIPDCLTYHWPSFQFKPYYGGKRIFPKESFTEEDEAGPSTSESRDSVFIDESPVPVRDAKAPLLNLEVASAGKLGISKGAIVELVEKLGGKYTHTVSLHTVCVISTKAEIDWMTSKIMTAKGLGVHIVSEDFLKDIEAGGDVMKLVPKHSIAPWAADILRRISRIDPFDRQKKLTTSEEHRGRGRYRKRYYRKYGQSTGFKPISEGKTMVQLEGGVDRNSGLAGCAHVLKEGDLLFTATLGMVDATQGTNSYYKIQLLESDEGNSYWIFRAWGRVGTSSGGNRLEKLRQFKSRAQKKFMETYFAKTGNKFGSENFEKIPNKFYPLEIDYGKEEASEQSEEEPMEESKLPPEIENLMKLIFDITLLKKTLVEFEIDMDKMPLGKLSRTQILKAYSVLTQLQTLIEAGNTNRNAMLDATNRFFTLIPHNFGLVRTIPLLDTLEIIQQKTNMLDSLLEIEATYSLLMTSCKGDKGGKLSDSPDVKYEELRCPMEVVPKNSDEFKMIQMYCKNTHGSTHSSYSLQVEEVFRLDREGETSRFEPFKDLHNRMLLWHGSRLSNFGGILSQGLRIAPPEAPKTGYMFGKGVYFADMVSKSANYCFTSRGSPTGLMLLCEVAIGNMHELKDGSFIAELPEGKHSTKGQGGTCPDPAGQLVLEDGVIVPTGVAKPSDVDSPVLLYNEYIVYDVAQIRMKYLIKMKFRY